MPYLDSSLLEQYRHQRLLTMHRHPQYPHLQIWNYTAETQYSKAWDAVTTQCRGLILDTQRERVHAACLKKFWNLEEHHQQGWPVPDEPPLIFEKWDGWYGALSWIDDAPWISTRGSFVSPGALWATDWFRACLKNMSTHEEAFWRNGDVTHIFEIIASVTRIVVPYDFEGLVHLAMLHRETGQTLLLPHQLNPSVKPPVSGAGGAIRWGRQIITSDYTTLTQQPYANSEGFVVLFPKADVRVKYKFAAYVALHRVITGLSVRVIYEHLASGQPLSALLDVAPDEMYPWIKEKAEALQLEYDRIEAHARIVVKEAQRLDKYPTRKDQAALITSLAYPGVCFSLLDGKDPAPSIWKLLRPTGSEIFRQEAADA